MQELPSTDKDLIVCTYQNHACYKHFYVCGWSFSVAPIFPWVVEAFGWVNEWDPFFSWVGRALGWVELLGGWVNEWDSFSLGWVELFGGWVDERDSFSLGWAGALFPLGG